MSGKLHHFWWGDSCDAMRPGYRDSVSVSGWRTPELHTKERNGSIASVVQHTQTISPQIEPAALEGQR